MTIIEVVELLKAVIFGFMQGVTEWLPVSSTGHMILLNEFLPLYQSEEFLELFFVVIQFGSILAVPLLFWKRMVPCAVRGGFRLKPDILLLWGKITVACIPAGVAALLWNDEINDLFYHPHVVVIMLIVVGVLFLVVETRKREPSVHTVADWLLPDDCRHISRDLPLRRNNHRSAHDRRVADRGCGIHLYHGVSCHAGCKSF